ncbi:MAG: hypothetical protein R3C45_17775, partial [Phycisphaerales bacterium]
MRFVKHLEIAARRWRNLFNTTNAHAPERTNKHSNSGIVPLEELENRTLLSATPFTLEPSGNEAPAVVAAGLAAIDPEDSLIAGDLDSDGFVGISDLNIILGNWNDNVPPGNPAADPSGDGFVGINDLNIILGNWNNSAIVDTFSGLTVNGRIIHGSDVDTYSINAQAGDDLFVSFSEIAAFSPGMNVAIYGPTNVLLTS